MKNPNHAMLLCYNLSPAKAPKLKAACIKAGIRIREIAPEQFTLPLGHILGHDEFADAAPTQEPVFHDELVVFYRFTNQQLDRLLADIRKAGGIRLKAVVTPTNLSWNACALVRELIAEREAIAKNQQAHQA